MALTIRGMGRCWEDVGEQKRGPVSLGINLATGSTNRLSPPISRQHTDSYLYCQVAAAAAAAQEKRRDSSKKLRRIGTPAKQNAMQQDTLGVLAASEAWICVAAQCRRGSSQRFHLVYSMWKQCRYCRENKCEGSILFIVHSICRYSCN